MSKFKVPKAAVAVNVYKESLRQVTECLGRISLNLPGAKVAVFINGTMRPDVCEAAKEFGFAVTVGENLGTNRTWHLWWLRMLQFFTSAKREVCFKLDPDTMVDRTPIWVPNAPYFGHVSYNDRYGFHFVQGGVVGLSATAVARILSTKILEPSSDKKWFVQLPESAAFADDQLIAVALSAIGIYPSDWPECKSEWREVISNQPVVKAIIHPRYYNG